jgi:hypothetical protein
LSLLKSLMNTAFSHNSIFQNAKNLMPLLFLVGGSIYF